MRSVSRLIAIGAGSVVATAGVTIGVMGVAGADSPSEPPALVEDYTYPNAAEIKDAREIELIKGNGKITLENCDGSANLITVEVLGKADYCFRATGEGFLTMRLERAFFIWTGDRPVDATVEVKGERQDPIHIEKNDVAPVGAEDKDNRAVLLELRTVA